MSGHTDAAVVIEAPMDLVWDMTNDLERWPDLFTEYAEVEILERNGDTVLFHLAMHPDENGTIHHWTSERTADRSTHTVRSRRVEAHVFDYMDIFWSFQETGEGVEMRWVQDFHVSEQMPFGDEEMAAHLKKNTAVEMAHIKKRIEEAAARS